MSLYLAIGGGGDVVFAAALAGEEAVGQLPWERFVVDPEPGPVPPGALREVVELGGGLYLATPRSYAERGGRIFKTQGMCVAEVLKKSVYLADPYKRPSELSKTLSRFNKIIGVDVGGDVLGIGCEDSLRSPLSDAYGLAVLAQAKELGIEAEVWVMSPGADGELSREYLMNRLAEAARAGALLGSVGIGRAQIDVLESLVGRCVTEASAVAVRAFRGEHGPAAMRGGTREIVVDACALVGFRFDPSALLALNKAARLIYQYDAPIDEAAEILLAHGMPTELHLERLLAKGMTLGEAVEELKRMKRC
ncbi:Uncharacterized protein conserved in archaea [Pyrobaculum oguniense TE7]|uniref:Uncharacterized protein conserved in archaea n=1 Tax=Pyrobaculum oguniense (strain DSM 13380 / JCM 10595 / TE7) TaxID=698757 RepID=H6Q8W4_PYROT|nr:Uncharacterized protein conserved in archaea [Pyrobaculum oguniense TE7]